jgi:hypothetical protein
MHQHAGRALEALAAPHAERIGRLKPPAEQRFKRHLCGSLQAQLSNTNATAEWSRDTLPRGSLTPRHQKACSTEHLPAC